MGDCVICYVSWKNKVTREGRAVAAVEITRFGPKRMETRCVERTFGQHLLQKQDKARNRWGSTLGPSPPTPNPMLRKEKSVFEK